jgi:hypothetical protein
METLRLGIIMNGRQWQLRGRRRLRAVRPVTPPAPRPTSE